MAAKEMLGLLKEAGNLPSEELEVGIMLSSDTSQAMINRVSGFLEYWSLHSPAKWERSLMRRSLLISMKT